jgi:hypothetical protein
MNILPKDILIEIALNLDLPEVIIWCRINKKFNQGICASPDFWNRKLYKDYGITSSTPKYDYMNKKLYTYYNIRSNTPDEALTEINNELYTFYLKYGIKDRKNFEKDIGRYISNHDYEDILVFYETETLDDSDLLYLEEEFVDKYNIYDVYKPSNIYSDRMGYHVMELITLMYNINEIRMKYAK